MLQSKVKVVQPNIRVFELFWWHLFFPESIYAHLAQMLRLDGEMLWTPQWWRYRLMLLNYYYLFAQCIDVDQCIVTFVKCECFWWLKFDPNRVMMHYDNDPKQQVIYYRMAQKDKVSFIEVVPLMMISSSMHLISITWLILNLLNQLKYQDWISVFQSLRKHLDFFQ